MRLLDPGGTLLYLPWKPSPFLFFEMAGFGLVLTCMYQGWDAQMPFVSLSNGPTKHAQEPATVTRKVPSKKPSAGKKATVSPLLFVKEIPKDN